MVRTSTEDTSLDLNLAGHAELDPHFLLLLNYMIMKTPNSEKYYWCAFRCQKSQTQRRGGPRARAHFFNETIIFR
jgi:hypothetical protein